MNAMDLDPATIQHQLDQGAARRLAAFATSASPGAQTRAEAARAVLDTLAVTLGGSGEAAVARLASTLEPSQAPGAVASLWSAERWRPEDAALLFGTASHVLDY